MKKGVLFVIFGATGDLTKRKLIPGIYNLLSHNRIKDFHIMGVSRRPLTAEAMINSAKPFMKHSSSKLLNQLKKNSSYHQIDFTNKEDFHNLKKEIIKFEKKGYDDKIFYLSTSPDNFEVISKNMQHSKLAKPRNGYSRVVFEKPFGLNLKDSRKLNKSIKKIFHEDQIYRIDHYLGKELVGNISIMRFTNIIFEPIWSNEYIDSIQIILDEDIGIEERGPFYDKYGAIKDVMQNHMLQLLALLTMEEPKSLIGDAVRDKKAEVIKDMKVKDVITGQYDGYKKERGINPKSKTETFAAMQLEINNKRWKGVPIFFKAGKFLNKKETKIVVNFKKMKCLFEKVCPIDTNHLEISIHPNEGITLFVNSKTPGKVEASEVKLEFSQLSTFGPNTPEGYENLFADIIRGDQSVFTRDDEIDKQWQVVDKIKRGKLYSYKKGSKGPKELEAFNKKHNIRWRQK